MGNTPATNNGCCPKCGSRDIGDDNLNWWCNNCIKINFNNNTMKKILSILLLISSVCFSQISIDLSNLTQNIDLGQDCSSSELPQNFITTGDANLNDYAVNLRNSKLIITGNLNGRGKITKCGNSNSQVCVNGLIQNNPTIANGLLVDCGVLSNSEFNYNYNEDLPCKVYDITGKLIRTGTTKDNFNLPKNQIFIIKTDKYVRKIIFNN